MLKDVAQIIRLVIYVYYFCIETAAVLLIYRVALGMSPTIARALTPAVRHLKSAALRAALRVSRIFSTRIPRVGANVSKKLRQVSVSRKVNLRLELPRFVVVDRFAKSLPAVALFRIPRRSCPPRVRRNSHIKWPFFFSCIDDARRVSKVSSINEIFGRKRNTRREVASFGK